MAPMGTKRSSSAAGRPAKKAKGDQVSEKCAQVADALQLAQKEVPGEVITLLAGALPHSLTLYKEERHAFQTSLIEMVEKTLQKSQEALEHDLSAAQTFVSNGDAAKEERAAAVTSITARLQECQETHAKKVTERAEKLEATKTTEKELKAALAAQKDGEKEATAVESDKAALVNALKTLLAPLKEAAAGKAKQIHQLQKALTAAGVEDSLVSAIEFPLSKKPEARGTFDGVVLEQLELQVSAKIAAFDAKLQEAAPAREARAATVKTTQDAHDAAEAVSKAAAEELKTAKEAEAAAKADLASAKESARNLTSDLLEAAQKLDQATAALQAFRSGALAAFSELCERSAPGPEPVAEAEVLVPEAPAGENPSPEAAAA